MARPRKIKIDELKSRIDDYFMINTFYTVNGLCLSLDIDRHALVKWSIEGKGEYCAEAKKALSRIGAQHEERLGKTACVGSIFWLKCHGWRDSDPKVEKTEVTAGDGNLKVTIVRMDPEKDNPHKDVE